MNRAFSAHEFFDVPDGTQVGPVVNTGEMGLAFDESADGSMSIAAGQIRAGTSSQIHIHPLVTQVTYVISGALTITMQDAPGLPQYDIPVCAGQATLCEAGTAFQLNNPGDGVAHVLYIVCPAYVYEPGEDAPVYDDAVVVGADWGGAVDEQQERLRLPEFLTAARIARKQSLERVRAGQ